jgi:hypothetical protein
VTIQVDGSILISSSTRFKNDPTLLDRLKYEVQTKVSSDIFSTFINALTYKTCEINTANCAALQELAIEFGFDELLWKCTDVSGTADGASVVRICRLQKRIRNRARQANALKEQLEKLQSVVSILEEQAHASQ